MGCDCWWINLPPSHAGTEDLEPQRSWQDGCQLPPEKTTFIIRPWSRFSILLSLVPLHSASLESRPQVNFLLVSIFSGFAFWENGSEDRAEWPSHVGPCEWFKICKTLAIFQCGALDQGGEIIWLNKVEMEEKEKERWPQINQWLQTAICPHTQEHKQSLVLIIWGKFELRFRAALLKVSLALWRKRNCSFFSHIGTSQVKNVLSRLLRICKMDEEGSRL